MDNKILVFVGVLVVSLLISGCVDNSKTDTSKGTTNTAGGVVDNQPKEKTTSLSDCEKTITTEEWNNCIVEAASSNYDTLICKNIKYPSDTAKEDRLKEDCVKKVYEYIYQIAPVKKDASLCDKLIDSERYYYSYGYIGKDSCYMNVAVAKQDVSLCEKAGGYKDSCYHDTAVAKKDASLCEKISSDSYKDQCYSEVAMAKQDASLCGKISDSGRKDSCYSGVAVAKQDASLCEKITDICSKYQCICKITPAKQDVSMCEKISDSNKDSCYYEIAVAKQDASLCEKITYSYTKDNCYHETAVAKQDASLCAKISYSYTKDRCYQETAVQKACTAEAKVCPDGTAVVRVGPDCEFAPCPIEAITIADAIEIAKKSECTEKGNLKDEYAYNQYSKTWWIDLDMKPEFRKDYCNPACVVSEETKTADINMRCAGYYP